MNAKEYLSEYKKLAIKIKLLNRDIEKLIAEIGGGSIGIDDGMPRGTPLPDKEAEIAVKLVELKDEREAVLTLCIKKRKQIEDTIFAVQDPVYQQLLHDRYISMMNWAEITEDLGLTNEQYVRGKLHSRSLQAVEFVLRN